MAITRLYGAACAAIAVLLGLTAPASAAGLSPAEDVATNWGGFYVGGQLGGAWNDTDWHYKNPNWFNTLGPEIVINKFDMDGTGFLGGGQAGFNYQSGAWLFGIEGSVAGTDLSNSRPKSVLSHHRPLYLGYHRAHDRHWALGLRA